MNINKETIIRTLIIFTSIIFMILGLFGIWNILNPIITNVMSGESIPKVTINDFMSGIIFIVLGIILFTIGKNWRDIFKSISHMLVSLAILCFSISFIMISVNIHNEEIVNSVQPSIDYLLASSIDTFLNDNVEISKEPIKLQLSNNSEKEIFYVKNLTLRQANVIVEPLNIEISDEDQIFLGKFLIYNMHKYIIENNPEMINSAIPVSMLKNEIEKNGIDTSLLSNIGLVKDSIELNEDAYIKVIVSENIEIKEIIPSQISDEDVILIWKNLDFSENVSFDTKKKIVQLGIGYINKEIKKTGIEIDSIPVASISEQIPNEIKQITNYDILNNNITVRSEEIKELREDCKSNKINSSDFCTPILLTDYNNLMNTLPNMTEDMGLPIPLNFSESLELYNTTENLGNTIDEKTSKGYLFLFLGVLLMSMAIGTYYLNFKINNRELILIHVPYYIAKINLINYVPAFLLFLLMYFIIVSGKLTQIVSNLLPPEMTTGIDALIEMPIFQTILDIFDQIIFLNLIYLGISILLFGLFFLLLKKEVRNWEKESLMDNNIN